MLVLLVHLRFDFLPCPSQLLIARGGANWSVLGRSWLQDRIVLSVSSQASAFRSEKLHELTPTRRQTRVYVPVSTLALMTAIV